MSQSTHVFGIDLNSSEYELHPSEKDTSQTLSGNHCSTIRFNETLSSQLENFIHNNRECHDGMAIGSIEFSTGNRGKISFDGISDLFSNCILTVMKEPNINTEIYETQYDDPPSNAMFLRRKGFVHSKLILKQGPSNDRTRPSISLRQPASQRVTTTVKEIRGSQRYQRNTKRRYENLNQHAPPAKRLKTGVTLNQVVQELLYHGEKTFDQIRKVITSRTQIQHSISDLKGALNEMADYYAPTECWYLKRTHVHGVNWENSIVLTNSEKRVIEERSNPNANTTGQSTQSENAQETNGTTNEGPASNGTDHQAKEEKKVEIDANIPPEQRAVEEKYDLIRDQAGYDEYDKLYQDKFAMANKYLQSVKENMDYFKNMKALIKGEQDKEKQMKMTNEFRQIFNERKQGIHDMKKMAANLQIELRVLKKRINAYVTEQQQHKQTPV